MKKTLLFLSVMAMSISTFAQINSAQKDNSGNATQEISSARFVNNPPAIQSNPPVIIHAIPGPTSSLDDIAFDGVNLWVEGYGTSLLYKISPVNGSVIRTIPTTIQRAYGLEFVNGFLYVGDADNHFIQKVDTANGNVISSFPTPAIASSSYPTGLAWDGQYLWNNDAMGTNQNPNDSLFQINTTGQRIQEHHAFGDYTTGLAWDGQYLWSSNNGINSEIYKIDVSSFTVIDTIDAPGGWFPNGLAFDGQYLWVANNMSDSLYQIDIGNTTTGLSHPALTNFSDFSIYPNPADNEITIELSGAEIVGSTYSIMDETGREILIGKLNEQSTRIDISELSAGFYFVSAGKNGKQQFKLIKE